MKNEMRLRKVPHLTLGRNYFIPTIKGSELCNLAHFDDETKEFTFESLTSHIENPAVTDAEKIRVLNIDQVEDLIDFFYELPTEGKI